MSATDETGRFWYCVEHHRVEQPDEMCPPIHRLGPYGTYEAAARALQTAQERNDAWDKESWD